MDTMKPYQYTATEGLLKIEADTLSVKAWASSALRRIETRGAVKAWVYFNPRIIDEAEELDATPLNQRGPLHGLLTTVKDIIDVHGMPTQNGSDSYADSIPEVSSDIVKLLCNNGALILGKSTTTQFGASSKGPNTRNPHDLDRTPGGSSTGSAAAVADGQAAFGIGTQTGGSTIRPGSFNGIYAITFTFGVISTKGQWPFARSFDRPGFFARDPDIFGRILNVLQPQIGKQRDVAAIKGSKFAVCRPMGWERAGKGTQGALEDATRLLRERGAMVEQLALPREFDNLPQLYDAILRKEAGDTFGPLYDAYRAGRGLDESIAELLRNQRTTTDQQYNDAKSGCNTLRPLLDQILSGYAAMIVPSALDEAPMGLENTGSYELNKIWTALHVPMVNIPGFKGENGMPIGVTVIVPRYQDGYLIAVAKLVGEIFTSEGGWKNLAIEHE